MPKMPALFPVILAALLALAPLPSCALAVGDPAPEIAAARADGTPVQLSSLRGKAVYLDFWASWCGPCRLSFPWMSAMQEKYGTAGLAIVAVNVDKKRADAERFLAQFPPRFAIVYDEPGATPLAYQVKKMPTSVLIDATGRVVSVHSGFTNEMRGELEAKLRAALPAKPPSN
jgi:thiol-disulfide isomerase/thioredoxin